MESGTEQYIKFAKNNGVHLSHSRQVAHVYYQLFDSKMLTGTYMLQTLKSKFNQSGGSDLPNMQTGNRNHNSRYYKLPTI